MVRVGVGGGLAATPFARALAAFRIARPGVAVQVQVCRGRDRVRGVARGEFDLALVSHDEAQVRAAGAGAAELRVETLREQSLVVAAAAGSDDGKKLAAWPAARPVSPALLAGRTLLGLDGQSGVRRQVDRSRTASGMPGRRATVFPGGWAMALACARLGIGAAVLPADMVPPADAALVARPFLPDVRIADRVVWAAENADDRVADLVACLKSTFTPDG